MPATRSSQKLASKSHILEKRDLTLLPTLKTSYDRADGFCRTVQMFMQEAGIPAMNELRYSGHHLLAALTGSQDASAQELTKAINHCDRAAYEAAEAGNLSCLEKIHSYKKEYSQIVISEVVSDWHQILAHSKMCQQALASARLKGDGASADWETLMTHFNRNKSYVETLEQSRDDLNSKVSMAKKEGRRFAITVLIATVGLIVAVVFGLVQIKN